MNASPWLNRREFIKQSTLTGAALAGASLAAAPPSTQAVPRVNRDKVRVGLIGCGSVSGAYLPSLKKEACVELVSVCDIIPERAKRRAEQHQVRNVYPHIDAMLAGADFDLLVNTTSMPSHYPVNRKALLAGKHVWSEKPMALEVAQGEELITLARQRQVGFWAAPNCVISPQFKFMAETIASGRLGKVTAAHGTYGHGGPTWSGWFYQKGGGSLYDLGVYNVTTLTGLLGPVREVVGMTDIVYRTRKVDDLGEVKVEADENTMLIMKHAGGALSHVQTGFGYFEAHAPVRQRKLHTIDVIGTGGAMYLQGWDWAPEGVDLAYQGEAVLETHCRDPWKHEWVGGAAYIAECLVSGAASLITPEHGLHVLDVMNGCHASQRTGRRVRVRTEFPWPIIRSA